MKHNEKTDCSLLAMMVSLGVCYAETTSVPEGADVIVIFAQQDKQPLSTQGGRIEYLDTYWIYYDDMTFDQYTCLQSDPILFSTGTDAFAGEKGDFGSIIVRREQKFQAGLNLAEYESEHTYHPFEMGYVMLVEKQADEGND